MPNRILYARRLRRAVTQQPSSGLSITEYCRARKIPLSTFHYWRKRIRAESEPPALPFPSVNATSEFIRLLPHPRMEHPGPLELSYPDGRVLRLPCDIPVETLLIVLKGYTP